MNKIYKIDGADSDHSAAAEGKGRKVWPLAVRRSPFAVRSFGLWPSIIDHRSSLRRSPSPPPSFGVQHNDEGDDDGDHGDGVGRDGGDGEDSDSDDDDDER